MSKKKSKVRSNDKANNNDRNVNNPNETQNVTNPSSRDAKESRRHYNIKKEDNDHRWPKQL